MSAIVQNRPVHSQAPDFEEDVIELGDLLATVIQAKWLVLLITIGTFLLGVAYTFVATPVYQADGMLQVEERKAGLGSLDFSELFEVDTSINAEIEILRSRSVLGDVVDHLKLDIVAEPVYMPVIGAALARRAAPSERKSIQVDRLDLPAGLVGRSLTLIAGSAGAYRLYGPDDTLLLEGAVGQTAESDMFGEEPFAMFVAELTAEPGDRFIVRRRARFDAIASLQAALGISERGRNSGILAIRLVGDDPEKISRQINEIANIYVRQNVERKSAEAQKTLSFLDVQLPIVKRDMEAAEVALNTFRLEKGSVDLPLETQSILATIVEVEAQINQLKQEREIITQGYTSEHPTVIGVDNQINRLMEELANLNDRVKDLPNTQQELLRLFRDVQVSTELYTSLLNTAQELRVVKAGTVGNVRVVDYAVPRYNPIKPKKAQLQLLFLMVGGALGVVGAFVRKALSGGVQDPDLVEKKVGLPVYAIVGHSKKQDRLFRKMKAGEVRHGVLAAEQHEDPSIESIRNLRTMLHFGMLDVTSNIILISGPSPSVGKSFVSVNLAAVLASSDKKVLTIDGDLRKGYLHQYLGIQRDNGLSEFVGGEITIGEAIHETPIKGLDLIPTGKLPPNPAELLLHKRFANCLNVLSPRYDHIIIDSPPILAVTDASIIGQLAGATLMVIKAGGHPMREIEQSVKRLRQANVNLRGILFNDMDVSSQRYGAGKYSYQYAYKKK